MSKANSLLKKYRYLWIIILIAILAICAYLFYQYNKKPEIMDSINITSCKNNIIASLKSPGTAVFGQFQEATDNTANYVKGYVDSQNSYGGLLRLNFICMIDVMGGVQVFTSEDENTGSYEAFNTIMFDSSIPSDQKFDAMRGYTKNKLETIDNALNALDSNK